MAILSTTPDSRLPPIRKPLEGTYMDIKNLEYRKKVKKRHGDTYIVIGEFLTKYRTGSDILHKCKEHGEYSYKPFANTRKTGGCPECRDRKDGFVKTHKDYVHHLKINHPTIKLLEKFTGTRVSIKHSCTIHGEFKAKPVKAARKNNKFCPLCGVRKLRQEMEYTIEHYNTDLGLKFDNRISFVGKKLEHPRTAQKHNCAIHGNFIGKPEQIYSNKYGCPACSFENKGSNVTSYTLKEMRSRILNLYGNMYKIIGFRYIGNNNNTTIVDIKCKKHGLNSFLPYRVMQGKVCKKCSAENKAIKKTKTNEQYSSELLEIYNGKILNVNPYKKVNEHLLHKCSDCSTEWNVTPSYILSGCGCPSCTKVKYKLFNLGKREVRVQGKEPEALTYLLSIGYKPKDIIVQSEKKIPTIKYEHKGKLHSHFPDIFIPKENRIIEVKSGFTFGLTEYPVYGLKQSAAYSKIRSKTKGALKQGFDYEVFIMDGDTPTKLPERWYKFGYSSFIKNLE